MSEAVFEGVSDRATHVVTVPPTQRGRDTQEDRDLVPLRTAERVSDQVGGQIPVLERESFAFASSRLLTWLVGCVRTHDRGRIGCMREHGLPSLRSAHAAEMGADEGNDLLVVEAIAAGQLRSVAVLLFRRRRKVLTRGHLSP